MSQKLIFEDNVNSLENWTVEKWVEQEAQVEVKNNKLYVTSHEKDPINPNSDIKMGVDGVMIWLKQKLPENFRFEYDLTPTSKSGFFLIHFNVNCPNGISIDSQENLSEKSAPTLFKKYTKHNIETYHISYRRNEEANCNLRKNPDMHLLKQTILDKVMPKDQSLHVILTKQGGQIQLKIDDTLFMDFTDDGTIGGPIRKNGYLGLRQVYESSGFYENFKLYQLN